MLHFIWNPLPAESRFAVPQTPCRLGHRRFLPETFTNLDTSANIDAHYVPQHTCSYLDTHYVAKTPDQRRHILKKRAPVFVFVNEGLVAPGRQGRREQGGETFKHTLFNLDTHYVAKPENKRNSNLLWNVRKPPVARLGWG